MTTCLVLFVSAWAFVRLISVPAAVGLCLAALALPPIAVILGNRREPDDHWFDEDEDEDEGDRGDQDGQNGRGDRSGRSGQSAQETGYSQDSRDSPAGRTDRGRRWRSPGPRP